EQRVLQGRRRLGGREEQLQLTEIQRWSRADRVVELPGQARRDVPGHELVVDRGVQARVQHGVRGASGERRQAFGQCGEARADVVARELRERYRAERRQQVV